MFSESDLLPLSALQHLLFCERQVALIHLEGAWEENALTIQGRHMHKQVDGRARLHEARSDVRVARGLALHSYRLGLVGKADLVEFRRASDGQVRLDKVPGAWAVRPVEYKRGRPKRNPCDRVQVCAQALCLEEMLACNIAEGVIFYGRTRRRIIVKLDAELRRLTEDAAARLHALIRGRTTPPAIASPKCKRCSLAGLCLPDMATRDASADYLHRHLWGPAP